MSQQPPFPPQSTLMWQPQPAPKRRSTVLWLSVVAALLAAALTAVTVILIVDRKVPARYEASSFSSPNPFTESVARNSGEPARAVNSAPGGVQTASYRSSQSCDTGLLKSRLADDPSVAAAWAEIMGIGVDRIGATIDALRPATLVAPMQVTNHDYEAGKPVALQSVLDAGTAVLVDSDGVPRVRCACGNPLKPAGEKATEIHGAPADFDPGTVVTEPIAPTPARPGTDCAVVQLPDGRWADVRVVDGDVACDDAIGAAYDYTENPDITLPATVACRPTGDQATLCRSSNGTIEISASGGDAAPSPSSEAPAEEPTPAAALDGLTEVPSTGFTGQGSGYRGTLFANSDGSVRCNLHLEGTDVYALCFAGGADLSDVRPIGMGGNSIGWSATDTMPYSPFSQPPSKETFQGSMFTGGPPATLKPGQKIAMKPLKFCEDSSSGVCTDDTKGYSTIECGNVDDAIICVVDGGRGFRLSTRSGETWA